MRSLKKVSGLFLASALIASLGMVGTASASDVSDIGQNGFKELSRCLNSNDVLDVYYMIDESSSLSSGSGGVGPGSDPNDDRATILAASVESLQSLKPGLKVNVGVATFAANAREQRPWTEMTNESSTELANWMRSAIPDLDQGSATNWEAALTFSQQKLSNSGSDPANRCQALVWFTDGSLNVAGDSLYDNINDRTAMGNLCGPDHIRQEMFLPRESSVVSELRASGVTILGVLLQDKNWDQVQLDYASLMRSIVEGEGSTGEYSGYTCGVVPIPPTSRPGALLVAANPFDLAYQFQAIGQQASGGVSVPLSGNPAEFSIENGVSSFNVVTTDKSWKLTAPDGSTIDASNAESLGFDVVGDVNSTRISKSVAEADFGLWTIFIADTANQRAVYLFSGLGISLYNTDFFDGEKGSITGVVVRELDGKPVDLSVYNDAQVMSLSLVGSNGTLLSPISVPINSDGSFSLSEIDYPTDRTDVDMRLQLNLKTKSGIELAPVAFAKSVKITLRKDFPSVDPALQMTNLVGKNPSVGTLTLLGPESGSGRVCIGTPQVRDTEVNRIWDETTTTWTVDGADVSNTGSACVDLAQGESRTVQVSLQNDLPAESQISGEVPVTLQPANADLGSRKVNVPFEATSTRAGSTSTVVITEVILTIIGILGPLALLYFLTLLTTKFSAGSDLLRSQVPVVITSSGMKIREGEADAKFAPIAPMDDVRDFNDSSGLASMRAQVSKLVFPAPWFEAKAASGTRLISFVAAPRAKAVEFESGKTVAIGPDVGKHALVSVSESDLVSTNQGEPLKASLILYSRLGVDTKARLNEILMLPGTWDRATALKSTFDSEDRTVSDVNETESKRKFKKSSKSSSDAASAPMPIAPGITGGGSVPPPPPGSSGGSVPPPPPGSSGGSFPPPPPGSTGGVVPPPPPV